MAKTKQTNKKKTKKKGVVSFQDGRAALAW